MRPGACFILAFMLGHIVSGEYSPVRLFLMRIFARYIEVPLLHLCYLGCGLCATGCQMRASTMVSRKPENNHLTGPSGSAPARGA